MEKPLHVRVAEVVGWTKCAFTGPIQHFYNVAAGEIDHREWTGVSPYVADRDYRCPVWRYDKSWDVTGPLKEKYGITVIPDYTPDAKFTAFTQFEFIPYEGASYKDREDGETELLAICHLVEAIGPLHREESTE
jgi:hypothetical protein